MDMIFGKFDQNLKSLDFAIFKNDQGEFLKVVNQNSKDELKKAQEEIHCALALRKLRRLPDGFLINQKFLTEKVTGWDSCERLIGDFLKAPAGLISEKIKLAIY